MNFFEEHARILGTKLTAFICIAMIILSFAMGAAFVKAEYRRAEIARMQQKALVVEAVKEAMSK